MEDGVDLENMENVVFPVEEVSRCAIVHVQILLQLMRVSNALVTQRKLLFAIQDLAQVRFPFSLRCRLRFETHSIAIFQQEFNKAKSFHLILLCNDALLFFALLY